LVISSSGKYVLHRFHDGSSSEKIEKICKILDFCGKNGAQVPIPIHNKRKHFVEKNSNYFLTKFIVGKQISKKNNLNDLAKQLAILHKVLNKKVTNYNYRIGERFYKKLTKNEFSVLKRKLRNKKNVDSFDKLIIKNLKFLEKLTFDNDFTAEYKRMNFKKQLIHFDLHPGNVLFRRNKVSGILDFNAMRQGFPIQDVVFCAFRFGMLQTKSPIIMKKIILNFISIYMKENPIHDQSKYYFEILQEILLGRVNYILKKRYFFNSNVWINDLTRNLSSLILVNKILLLQK